MGFWDGVLREEGIEGCYVSDWLVLVFCFWYVWKGKFIREGLLVKGCCMGECFLGVWYGMVLYVLWVGDIIFLFVVGMYDGVYWEERVWCRGVEVRMVFGGCDKFYFDIF